MSSRQPTRFGWWLWDARKARGLSQQELAERAGIGQATISRWTHDPVRPDLPKLQAVADALKLTDAERMEMFALAGASAAAAEPESFSEAADWPEPLIEARMMLLPSSPLTDRAREQLLLMLDAVVAPHREAMRRRKRAS